MNNEPLYENGIQGMYWCHTAYGGDDYDSMGFCDLDDEKVQTVGVHVAMPTRRVDFHMNCDRLGMVDPQEGQRAFDLNVQAARLFVAAPDLLAAAQEAVKEGKEWFDDDSGDYSSSDCVDRMMTVLQEAITKANGGA